MVLSASYGLAWLAFARARVWVQYVFLWLIARELHVVHLDPCVVVFHATRPELPFSLRLPSLRYWPFFLFHVVFRSMAAKSTGCTGSTGNPPSDARLTSVRVWSTCAAAAVSSRTASGIPASGTSGKRSGGSAARINCLIWWMSAAGNSHSSRWVESRLWCEMRRWNRCFRRCSGDCTNTRGCVWRWW